MECYDIAEYKPMFSYGSETTVNVTLPVSELERIAENHEVGAIREWDISPDKPIPDAEKIFSYDSANALKILRASVGLEEKRWSPWYDVNQDGTVDSVDSLQALRQSVGLEDISYNIIYLYPAYDVEKYGLADNVCPYA